MESDFTQVLSELFNLPSGYFTYPNVVFYFLLPFIAATYFWYILLSKKLRIFKRSPFVNFVIAFTISFLNAFMIASTYPSLTVSFFVAAAFFIGSGWTLRRFLIMVGIFFFIQFVYSSLMSSFI